MKEEEFNDFLRNRADSFELKPSSGSFDEVARKLKNKKKRRGVVFFILPLLLLAGISAGYYFTTVGEAQTLTAKNISEPKPLAKKPANSIDKEPLIIANIEGEDETAEKASEQVYTIDKLLIKKENDITSKPVINMQKAKPVFEKSIALKEKEKKGETKGTIIETKSFSKPENPTTNKQEKTTKNIDNTNANEKENKAFLAEEKTNSSEIKEAVAVAKKANKDKPQPTLDITPDGDDCAVCGCLTKKWTLRAYYKPFGMKYYKGNININSRGDEDLGLTPPVGGTSSYERSFVKENLSGKSNLGINLEYRLTKRLSIGSGIGLSRWSSEIGEWTVTYRKDIVNVYSVDTPSNIIGTEEVHNEFIKDSSSYTNDVASIQIPLYLNLSLLQKPRFSLDVRVGAIANYIQKVTTIKDFKQPTRVGLNNSAGAPKVFYNNFNLNITTGLFANYTIGKCWGIYAGPSFGAAITSIHNSENFEYSKPYTWGLETGLRIKF